MCSLGYELWISQWHIITWVEVTIEIFILDFIDKKIPGRQRAQFDQFSEKKLGTESESENYKNVAINAWKTTHIKISLTGSL